MSRYLIVVDMQRDFVDGALGTPEAEAITGPVCECIRAYAQDEDARFIFTLDTHGEQYLGSAEGRKLPVAHCIRGTEGWELHPDVLKAKDAISPDRVKVFEKPTFGSRDLAEYLAAENELESIDSIDLIGLCTDICVISNALMLKGFLPEMPIKVRSSCCAGVSPESHERALEAMRMCHIDIV